MPSITLHHRFWPPGRPLSLDYPERTLFGNLAEGAAAWPDRPLLVFHGRTMSYGEVLTEVEHLAGYLQHACGVARGDRVLLDLQNCPQFVIAYYAILRADAVVVPVNPMMLADELHHVVEDSGARVGFVAQDLLGHLVAHGAGADAGLREAIVVTYGEYAGDPPDEFAPPAVTAARDWRADAVPGTRLTGWRDALAAEKVAREHLATPDDHALLPYSSGTTGRPKGCVHPHRTFMATAIMQQSWHEQRAHPVVLSVLPMFHATGMQAGMNTPILIGATVVQMLRWDRRAAAELIRRHRVTGWTAITTMAIDFLAQPGVDSLDLSSLTRIGGGGAAMPAAIAARLKGLTGLDFLEGYGLTETAAPTHMNPFNRPKPQCAGIPCPDTDARVVDPGSLIELGPNEHGEIVVSGPQVFRGYWRNPQADRDVFFERDGKRFFRTGDLGYYDDEGYFFITDRLKRMINASGFKVWPAEIEAMMYAHPDVREACVIAASDPHRGETVKAVVVPARAGADAALGQAIIDWCRERMAAYKVPRIVEFVDALPRSGAGKVLWRVLQERERATAPEGRPEPPR